MDRRLTQDEVDRKSTRKQQLETEIQGTTEERKAEIEAELAQINADLQAHRAGEQKTTQDQRSSVRQPRTADAPGT